MGDELETVPVTGDDKAVLPFFPAEPGQGTQKVIGFESLQLHAGNAHLVQHFFNNRHLLGQLVGHPLPLGLIAFVF